LARQGPGDLPLLGRPQYLNTQETIRKRFDQEGISLPFPQQDIHLHPAESSYYRVVPMPTRRAGHWNGSPRA
jgi:hypothetical protein